MIKNIQELQNYILRDFNENDEEIFKRRHRMTSPGSSKEQIEHLKKTLQNIPESYSRWVEEINLNGISIGYFEVSPSSYNPEGMVANLIEGNQGEVMFHEYMNKYKLYSIATISDFGIFVATSASQFKEGEIIAIDESIYAEEENLQEWIFRIAKDFEQFLIIAGNLNQTYREFKEDTLKRRQEFFERLKILKVPEEYYKAWEMFI
jgi:hypothetical protein